MPSNTQVSQVNRWYCMMKRESTAMMRKEGSATPRVAEAAPQNPGDAVADEGG